MLGRVFKSKVGLLAVGVAAGAVAASGFSIAIAATRSGSSDTYYACVAGTGSSAGKVNASTIKLGSPPTKCPKTTDVVKSWNAQGIAGRQGPEGPRGPAAGAGSVYAATTFKFTSEGCPILQGKFVISRTWGASMDWRPDMTARHSGRCADASNGFVGGRFFIPSAAMPDGVWLDTTNRRVNFVKIDGTLYNFVCVAYTQGTVFPEEAALFDCGFQNYNKSNESQSSARERFWKALDRGIEVGPVEFMALGP